MNKISLVASVGAFLALFPNASASPIVFTPVRASGSDTESVAFDQTTGKYYQRPGHGLSGQDVFEYADFLAFEAGVPSRTVTMEGGFYGTYIAANGGKLFGRSQLDVPSFEGTDSSRFNLTTGAKEMTASFPGLLSRNGDDTFDWGGLTAVNFFNDPSGMYFLGKGNEAGGRTWHLNKVDGNLNVLETKTFESSTLGFAAMINGKLFTGENYNGPGFDHVFDFMAGTYTTTEFTIVAGVDHYFDDMVYDANIDTLYLHNFTDQTFYKLGNASKVIGVPETGSGAWMLGCALGGLLLTSRSLRSAKS